MKLQFLALPLLVALMLSPMLASAATGSITFSSPSAGSSYSGTTAYTISGTITPTPTLPDNVVITVTLQGGSPSPLDEQTVAAGAGGTFTYSTNAGGSAAWVSGTYVITAFDSNGATGTTTFKYTATIGGSTSSTGYVTIVAPSLLVQGQTGNIFIWSSSPGSITAWVLAPGATSTTALTATRVSPNPGSLDVYAASYTVAATAANGVYLVGAAVTNTTSTPAFSASNIGSFTVNGGVVSSTALSGIGTNVTAIGKSVATLVTGWTTLNSEVTSLQSSVASLNTAVGTLTTNVNSITTSLGTVSSDVSALQTSISTLSSTVNTISTSVSSLSSGISTLSTDVSNLQTTVNGLAGLSTQMTALQTSVTNLNSSVSNDQTYILVVAVLAILTLVLELAILIRKMS
jgi:prefoldin subunit 5